MLGSARLHRDVNGRVSQHDAVIGAVVHRFHDVSLLVGDHAGELLQRSRMIRQMDAQADQAAVLDEPRRMISERSETSIFPALTKTPSFFRDSVFSCSGAPRWRRRRRPPRAFFLFRAIAESRWRFLPHPRSRFVHVFLDQRKRQRARATHGDSVRNGFVRRQGDQLTFFERGLHRSEPRRLHADHFDFRIRLLDRAGHTRDQAASAHGNDERVEVAVLLQAFRGRAFPAPRSRPHRQTDE